MVRQRSSIRVRLDGAAVVVSNLFKTGDRAFSECYQYFPEVKFLVVNIYAFVKKITESNHEITCDAVLMSKV